MAMCLAVTNIGSDVEIQYTILILTSNKIPTLVWQYSIHFTSLCLAVTYYIDSN